MRVWLFFVVCVSLLSKCELRLGQDGPSPGCHLSFEDWFGAKGWTRLGFAAMSMMDHCQRLSFQSATARAHSLPQRIQNREETPKRLEHPSSRRRWPLSFPVKLIGPHPQTPPCCSLCLTSLTFKSKMLIECFLSVFPFYTAFAFICISCFVMFLWQTLLFYLGEGVLSLIEVVY